MGWDLEQRPDDISYRAVLTSITLYTAMTIPLVKIATERLKPELKQKVEQLEYGTEQWISRAQLASDIGIAGGRIQRLIEWAQDKGHGDDIPKLREKRGNRVFFHAHNCAIVFLWLNCQMRAENLRGIGTGGTIVTPPTYNWLSASDRWK